MINLTDRLHRKHSDSDLPRQEVKTATAKCVLPCCLCVIVLSTGIACRHWLQKKLTLKCKLFVAQQRLHLAWKGLHESSHGQQARYKQKQVHVGLCQLLQPQRLSQNWHCVCLCKGCLVCILVSATMAIATIGSFPSLFGAKRLLCGNCSVCRSCSSTCKKPIANFKESVHWSNK